MARLGATPAGLTECDLEPIHLSGAVQPFGVLVAVEDGRIRQVSANAADLVGRPPEQVVGAPAGELPEVVRDLLGQADAGEGRRVTTEWEGWILTAQRDGPTALVEAERPPEGLDAVRLLGDLDRMSGEVGRHDDLAVARVAVCRAVRDLTGFDRVMVYELHDDGHGEVVAEERREDLEPYLGLHYPASDIPRQARRLYVENRTRLIADSGYDAVPLLGVAGDDPIDLTHVDVRSVAAVHLQYLRNMGVAASFSLSLVVGGELAGLIACHHTSPRYLDPSVRRACTLLSWVLSEQLGRAATRSGQLEDETRRGAQLVMLRHLAEGGGLARTLEAAGPDLRRLLDASAVVAVISGCPPIVVGEAPGPEVVERVIGSVREAGLDRWSTDELPDDLGWPGGAYVVVDDDVAVVWFRVEQRAEVTWAGDPGEGWSADGKSLTPRASFATWTESIRGRSAPWTAADHAAALAVRQGLLARRHVEPTDSDDEFERVVNDLMAYAGELELVNLDLTAMNEDLAHLAYVISHDLRSPLRSVRAFLELYAEELGDLADAVPARARESWQVIDESARTMQELLDALLEWVRVGNAPSSEAPVSLDDVLDVVVGQRRRDLDDIGATVTVGTLGSVPGDRTMLTRVFANLIDNAIKFRSPDRRLRLDVGAVRTGSAVAVRVADNGRGISDEAHDKVFEMFARGSMDGEPGVGAGLAIVRRIVERHRGSVGVESTLGAGTAFTVQLPGSVPDPTALRS